LSWVRFPQLLQMIRKAAGILLKDRKLLVEKSVNKEFFISPGGTIEKGETPQEALIRELREEFSIEVSGEDLELFGKFSAQAVNHAGQTVEMTVFVVKNWLGEPAASSEVEEIAWIDSDIPVDMKLGSIFAHDVIPRLKEKGLIN
jgi:8-oxo-dGTP diphosphatase